MTTNQRLLPIKLKRIPRKLKKRMKNVTVVMDIKNIPVSMTLTDVLDFYNTSGVFIYQGNPPEFIQLSKKQQKLFKKKR